MAFGTVLCSHFLFGTVLCSPFLFRYRSVPVVLCRYACACQNTTSWRTVLLGSVQNRAGVTRRSSVLCGPTNSLLSHIVGCRPAVRMATGAGDSDTELQIPDVPESFKGSLYCCPDCKAMSAVSRSDDSVVTCSTLVCVHTRPLHSIAVRCRYSCVIVTNAGVLATWSLSAHSRTTMGCVQLSICVVST